MPITVLWRLSRPQFLIAAITFGLTVLLSPLVIERLIDDLQFAGLKVNVLDAHPETARALRRVLATSEPI